MENKRISVVIPVYNEADNIEACLRRLDAALGGLDHEILICYDFDEDTTLCAIESMDQKPPNIRLVRNTLGRGAAYAIRSGFEAASGDVVVTTMADLSDPPEVIPAMAHKIRDESADVVSGSRYMRGGSQEGGTRLKRFLSRAAGLSLCWFGGVATHDATNNFRAYSRAFLKRVRVESRRGFEVALELTAKAHLKGFKVAEVPSSWVDRSAGESHFRMWRWIPTYLRWYLRTLLVPALVWGALAAATAGAFYLVAHYGRDIPWWDEFKNVPYVTGREAVTPAWLWQQHNEHRVVVPKLVYMGLAMASGKDFRAGMVFNVAVMAAIAFAFILAARRTRGRMALSDIFFPLAWLHWGHAQTMICGFQLQFVLSAALFCIIVLASTSHAGRLRSVRVLLAGLSAVLLPMCGAQGLFLTPPVIVWLIFAGVMTLRTGKSADRTPGYLLILFAGLTVFSDIAYFAGLTITPGMSTAPTTQEFLRKTVEFLTVAFGTVVASHWVLSAAGTLVLYALIAALALRIAAVRPGERVRVTAYVMSLVAVAFLAAAIGYGRGENGPQAGMRNRYIVLSLPALCCAYLFLVRYGRRLISRLGPFILFLIALSTFRANCADGVKFAQWRRNRSDAFRVNAVAGMSSRELAHKYHDSFYRNQREDLLVEQIEMLRTARLGPFRPPDGQPASGGGKAPSTEGAH